MSQLDPAPPRTPEAVSAEDSWSGLRKFTSARIGLGRSGGSWRTETLLSFRLDHARARDAVLKNFDWPSLQAALQEASIETVLLETQAPDRQSFLRNPDQGRHLAPSSRQILHEKRRIWGKRDLVILLSDGLSALAAEKQIVPTILRLLPILRDAGWSLYPLLLVPYARVKLQDEVGGLLEARQSLILLGERPGLGSPDSLGAYLTYQPGPGRTDAERNCVSNIRPEGLPPAEAAEKLGRLLLASARLQISGVALKDSPLVFHQRMTQP